MSLQDKKGVSLMISYVLLIVFAVIMGAIIFAWLKTYVPSQGLSCPDGTSVFIKESSFNDSILQLNLILRNNGRFDIAGYFIHAANSSTQELQTIDFSPYLNESLGGKKFGNSVVFLPGENSFGPGDTKTNVFDIPSEMGKPYSVNIIPTRYQIENNRQRFVSCSDAKVQGLVGEPVVSEGEPICGNGVIEGTEQCDDGGTVSGDGCSSTCQTEIPASCDNDNIAETGEFCDGTDLKGKTCQTQGFDTGILSCNNCAFDTSQCVELCGNGVVDAGVEETCDSGANCQPTCTCPAGYVSDGTNGCTTIGNGVCDPGETCAQEPIACNGQQAQCQTNQICQGGSCVLDTSGVSSCQGYCVLLGYDGVPPNIPPGTCRQEPPKCTQNSEIHEADGDQYCTGGAQSDTCCCRP